MGFDDSRRADELAAMKPALGPTGADVDADGVPLEPSAPPTKDLHLRINAYEHHWLRRIVAEDVSSMQRVSRLAIRDAIRVFQSRAQLPRTGT